MNPFTVPMPGRRRLAAAALAGAVALWATAGGFAAAAPQTGISRADLQRHDLDIPGHEAIQTRVDFAPGAVAARHRHPGEEIVYVLAGSLEYRLDGAPPKTLKAGDVLFIPTGRFHAVANVGQGPASELATYVVETGKPLVELAK